MDEPVQIDLQPVPPVPTAAPATSPLAAPAEPHLIAADLACSRCAYNLRGLTADMRCPECGTPIAQSLYGNWLRLADPAWLQKLKLGASLKLWGLLVGFIVGAATVLIMMAGVPRALITLLGLAGGIFALAAVFLITSPEPTIGKAEDPITLRKAVRLCAVLGFLGGQLTQGMSVGVRIALPVFLVVGHALTIAGIVAMFGEFVYFRRFARRIPDAKLAKRTTVVMWGFGAATIASFIVGIVALIFTTGVFGPMAAPFPAAAGPPNPVTTGNTSVFTTGPTQMPSPPTNVTSTTVVTPSPTPGGAPAATTVVTTTAFAGPTVGPFAIIGVFSCFAGLAFLVFGVLYISLLIRYYSAFKQAAAEADLIARGELPPFQPATAPPTQPQS